MHKIKIEQFEGPLDLLLQLIEEQKLEITKVALAQVTEQYIEILDQSTGDNVKPEELADFLVIAARLLLIKSKALLPFLEWGDEEEEEDLTKQLKIYKEYLDAMKVIQKMVSQKHFAYSREKMIVFKDVEFSPPPKLTKDKLAEVMLGVIRGLQPFLNLPTEVIKRTVNIQEKISQIRQRLYQQATTRFSDILREAKDKTEVIVSFLALLELIKQKTVMAKQSGTFDDIILERIGDSKN
ncbi:MAG: segregation/condensation protein A [Candidatus Buchananbacteria bacterium]